MNVAPIPDFSFPKPKTVIIFLDFWSWRAEPASINGHGWFADGWWKLGMMG
jgi:hypothetical protein